MAGAELPPPDQNLAFADAPCGLARTDARGTLLAVNGTLCQWAGRDAAQLVGTVRLQDLFTVGGRMFLQTHWMPLLQMQGSIAEVKLDLLQPAGSHVPVVLNALRRETPTGVVHEIALFIARDRDRYEKELLLSRERLEALVQQEARLRDEAKDRALFAEQMVGIVSHDLRNPLSAIHLGTIAMERGEPMTERQRKAMARIERSTSRALRLVAQLLDFTLARTGKGLAVVRVPLDLHAVAGSAVEELTTAFPERVLVHEPQGDGHCTADADRVEQLLGNLVGNAMAYGFPNSPVTVRSSVHAGSAELSVHNRGTPIPAEKIRDLFQPMVRGSHEAASDGVGLGLYIVSEIAKAHGGSVSVSSTADAGTTFVLVFPAAA